MRRALVIGAAIAAAGCGEEGASEPCGGPGVICTFMGTGEAGLGHDGEAPEDVLLYLPQDLTFGPDGRPYVLDWNNHRVRTVVDGAVQTVVGTGELGDAPEGPALETSLNHPTHIAFDPQGNMVMSAWHNSKVARIDMSTWEMVAICGTGARAFGGDGGPAETALLDLPVATAFDSQGRMYISDQANQRIRRVENDGTIGTVVGPAADYLPAGFERVCDPMDATKCKVCKADEAADPECAPQTPPRPQGFGGDGGPASEAFLYMPFSQSAPPAGRIEMGPGDKLYIADTGNQRIRVLEPDGTIRTIAGSGPAEYDPNFAGGYSGDGGPATQALLKRPTDVAVAPDGTVYIADTDNHCVRRVGPDGVISTFAGRCGERGYGGDGDEATNALLDRPYGVALDRDGNLYIADTHNHRIRVVYE